MEPDDGAPESYDDHQRNAVLVQCARCGRSYFMTRPQAICVCCLRAESKDYSHWGVHE